MLITKNINFLSLFIIFEEFTSYIIVSVVSFIIFYKINILNI